MTRATGTEGSMFLSTLPPGSGDRRLALLVALLSVAAFVAAAPFARLQLAQVPAFIPIYQTALFISDVVTAVLLCGQFNILRSRALLMLACGYLFTAAMIVAHTLSFPGLFAPAGLLSAGQQSTAWLYMFWHGGFPLFVIAYSRLRGRDSTAAASVTLTPRATIVAGGVAVSIVATGFAMLATVGHDLLPPIMQGNRYTPAMIVVVSSVWALSLVALIMQWRRCQRSVLDLWLTVVMLAWLFDIALSAVLNAGRFDLGFYAGRLYGLLAASFVLVVLLLENGLLYARLVETHVRERDKNAELARLSGQLENTNRELQQASRLKSEFLASMSHELRTPLNAVIGYSESLRDGFFGPMAPEHKDYVGQIFDSGQHLLALINDVLDLSKIEAGKMTLDYEEIALAEFVPGCLNIVAERAAQRSIALHASVEVADGRVVVDERRLRQIAYNLLSNAVKFTPDGGEVRLSARAVSRTEIGFVELGDMPTRLLPLPSSGFERFLEMRVSDNGVGISTPDLSRLFQAFQQLDSSLARRHDGTGLGLALVANFAELHGGTVGAASATGRGAHFAVWLPWRDVRDTSSPTS